MLSCSKTKSLLLQSGARQSPLSRKQADELAYELAQFHPEVEFKHHFIETIGDRDQKTSLRSLEKTDFFTKELDELLLNGEVRVTIHSAKDLPEPLPKGLEIAAITKGVDPSDSLVLRKGENLRSLRLGAVIATSSIRREEAVRELRADLNFSDVRGNIGQRLDLLENGTVDGVVIAEAALIRLGLTHLNRFTLPGETVPLQGQLAVLMRENDEEIRELFRCLDVR
ncbi:MAG: hydroxymethylbilane synthase [Waddliaceae bacterium]|nr:hydroxymethylbilane synthase [Waddliaceae bacterium]